ncbi:hypothetical protein ACFV5G_36390 [Streptomyces sp. NPDC059766]|uniref:hypothetical protein n=1 Tax=Streptomyces sp. NPDC059766 TaxID=3346940 RepID=UPI00365AF7E3
MFLRSALRTLFPDGIAPVMRARSAGKQDRSADHIEATACDLARTDPETALSMLRLMRGTQETRAYQDSLIPQDQTADDPADSPP